MATISELNVRLGLLYQDFDKSLGAVEKRLERSGRKFSQLGNDLVLSVTAPLVALGAAAIHQAGEIESLKLAMTSTFEAGGRSAAEAAKEVEALRETAKAPGLDFEQAVKGSIRLQGVGFSAEEARKTLVELANTIALTGGTAHELDAVTRQFAQMISKGRVLQEDVTILSENMPRIADLMKKAFGTQSVEAIRNMGVTGKEFVERITEAAAALPRVEGGIKNALVNAGAEARNSMAKLGEAIVKALDVQGLLKRFAEGLAGAAQWFENLSDEAQGTIVKIGVFLVALGPVVKIIGVVQSTSAATIGIFRGLGDTLKSVAGIAVDAGKKFMALNTTMKLTVIGGAIAAVTALYLAFDYLGKSITETNKVTAVVANVSRTAANNIAGEKAEVDRLTGVITSQVSTLDAKKSALERLKKISPEYYGALSLAKGQVEGITQATEAYIATLLKAAKAQAAREKLVEIERELLDIGERQEENARRRNAANSTFLGAIPGLKTVIDITDSGLQKTTKSLEAQKRALAGLITEIEGPADTSALKARMAALSDVERRAVESGKKTLEQIEAERAARARANASASEGAVKTAKEQAKAYESVLASIDAVNKKQEELGFDFLPEKTKEIENGVERLLEAGFGPSSKPIQKLKQYLADIRAEISQGFATPNAAQKSTGASTAAPAALPTLATATSVQSVSIETSGADDAIGRMEDFVKSLGLAQAAFVKLGLTGMKTGDELAAVWGRLQTGAITFGDALTQSAQLFQERYGQIAQDMLGKIGEIASGIVAIQANRAEQEKAILDEEYAGRIAAAEGSAAKQKQLQDELAAKKKEIDRKIAKSQQTVAIVQAVINTALGVTQALGSAPPPYNFILAALTAAAGAVQIATIKSQKFAEGGVVTKPTLGLVGEYPGAATNPEIISPERKMRQVFRDEMGGGYGAPTELFSVIRGEDLLLISDKAARRRERTI